MRTFLDGSPLIGCLVALLLQLPSAPALAGLNQTANYGCDQVGSLTNRFPTRVTCSGTFRAWANVFQTFDPAFGREGITVDSRYESYSNQYSRSFTATVKGINTPLETSPHPALYDFWDVFVGGFDGYFEVSWNAGSTADTLLLANGSQHHTYTNGQTYTPSLCSKNSDGSGECASSFRMFSQHNLPNTFAEFSKQVARSCFGFFTCRLTDTERFQAQVGSDSYSCTALDPNVRKLWQQALMAKDFFWVTWNSKGECTDLWINRRESDINVQ